MPTRSQISLPALLLSTIEERMTELESGTFSRFAVELVCYDLRIRRGHGITGSIAQESPDIQDAVDRAITSHYRPYQKTSGETIRSLLHNTLEPFAGRTPKSGSLIKERRWVFFPSLLTGIIDIRWRELGFRSRSDYVTSLIRYDLLLGGPHRFFRGDDCTPEMLDALDRETLQMFHENAQPRILADYLAEESAGRPLSLAERDGVLSRAGETLVQIATRRTPNRNATKQA